MYTVHGACCHRQRRSLCAACAGPIAVGVGFALGVTEATAGYYSLTGTFQDETDALDIGLTLDQAIGSATEFYFQTFSHYGGTNAAGEAIPGGSFNPTLRLFDAADVQVGSNNNAFPLPNRDALLSWPGVAAQGGDITVDPLPAGDYRLWLGPAGSAGVNPGQRFALDAVGPGEMSARSLAGTAGVALDTLDFGGSALLPARIVTPGAFTVGGSGAVAHVAARAHGQLVGGTIDVAPGDGVTGTLTAEGSGSSLNADTIRVGIDGGEGTLGLSGGAALQAQNLTVGTNVSGVPDLESTSRVDLSGDGTTASIADTLLVGGMDLAGTMTIRGGATVSADQVRVADVVDDSSGELTVTGASSRLDVSTRLWVGANDEGGLYPRGYLRVEEGGVVTTPDLNVGEYAFGSVEVTGPGSRLDVAGRTWFAFEGSSSALVSGGAALATGKTSLSFEYGSADMRVVGTGSTWTVSGDLEIGQGEGDRFDGGDATLAIDFGASVAVSGNARLGRGYGSQARVEINRGAMSVGGVLGLGGNGDMSVGVLAVRNQGTLATATAYVGHADDTYDPFGEEGSGTVRLQDASWVNTGDVYVGGNGTAPPLSGAGPLTPWGTIDVGADGSLDIGGLLQVWLTGEVHLADATLDADRLHNEGLTLANRSVVTTTNGVENRGDLVLIDSTINGEVTIPAGEAVNVIGEVTINGTVSGDGGVFGSGTVHFGGGVAPGASVGEFTVEHDAEFGSTAALLVELATHGADVLRVGGRVTLGGVLELSRLGGFVPPLGETTAVVEAGAVVGVFAGVNGVVVDDTTALAVTYGATNAAVIAALIGDTNLNGQVEQGDLDAVLQNWGLTSAAAAVSWTTGDLNGNGTVEQGDLDAVLQNWGSTAAPDFGVLDPAMLPEPGAASLAGLIGLGVLVKRSRPTVIAA